VNTSDEQKLKKMGREHGRLCVPGLNSPVMTGGGEVRIRKGGEDGGDERKEREAAQFPKVGAYEHWQLGRMCRSRRFITAQSAISLPSYSLQTRDTVRSRHELIRSYASMND